MSALQTDMQMATGRPATLGRIGPLETRLARNEREILLAKELRYRIFVEECGAKVGHLNRLLKRDSDRFDEFCDHLLVVDTSKPYGAHVVGTYRLMTHEAAARGVGFYSQSEFDLSPILKAHAGQSLMELGRSCILPSYRHRRTLELMWQGIWSLVLERKTDVLFGCASFPGCDSSVHQSAFSWLRRNACLETERDCLPAKKNSLSLSEADDKTPDADHVLPSLPPLLKGYLRVGAKVASHAVIDRKFGTTDVLVVLRIADIAEKYLAHYRRDASRFAA